MPFADDPVTQLYPPPSGPRPLAGLYLAHELRARGTPGRPFVYTNFITSLDGRISERDASGRRRVPEAIANARDWRLYLELMAQADVVLTTARHLRAIAAGRERPLPGLTGPEAAGLAAWREARGLAPAPTVAIASAELKVPAAALRRVVGPLLVLTHRGAPSARVMALTLEGANVRQVGATARLTAAEILAGLDGEGHRCIYSIAGPRMLHTLLAGDALDRLYLTVAHRVLGGTGDTLMPDDALAPPAGFTPAATYFDPHAPQHGGQLFLSLDRRPDGGAH
ncbi:RibD family protein [Denitromonas iodatirespirans]|uniref:Dihydrofolate reductase family protein n=1 Tax=Denitromonas iodatirespirans TaxID=2795389 RepID=A0A944D4G9_DENI1|nr:dihydrofolate reductase family protein [Denitromonas iodatirespirans]MBT0959850.1 dihydrofolate reductase family protein [Denitromonas iodatirespirans]